ncbi:MULTISPECIES: GNAT family N-acetyltransferase [unclassified Streptomyces]|uniref:GNAT family N-acetyltransferase n=1 Tax=unclassified Streptomyces TaxID=2593676 RepID=UPI002DD8419D|nr:MULTISPECIES: GNAT family N-acetyltransferase [unclassified Streptomyces]WSC25441.1 GNAT family N-acetyltransferase [Streptomyces sp. NBC_01768]WSP44481.1 GNAT family N-acetyltransferase [Streptomyces sp. NBC_01243]
MNVTLQVDSTPSASALFLRPWNDGDVKPLVEAYRDPTLRRWTGLPLESIEDAVEWLELQRRGWATGKRLSFAVHEDHSGTGEGRLAGNVVMKRTSSSQESAEVGYWTAVHARGRGVAPRALEALTSWAFDIFAVEGLERLDLLHQVDNLASCRVAEKARYGFHQILPARPPFPRDGHLHIRRADTPA